MNKTLAQSFLGFMVFSVLLCSCAGKKSLVKKTKSVPLRKVVILPAVNQTDDVTVPFLVEYFLRKQIRRRGFKSVIEHQNLKSVLRGMRLFDAKNFDLLQIRQIGQLLKAGGVFQTTIYRFQHDLQKKNTVMSAHFQLVEVKTGRILWQKRMNLEKPGPAKVPLKEIPSHEWNKKQMRSLSKTKAAKLPKEIVSKALDSLLSPSTLGDLIYKSRPK